MTYDCSAAKNARSFDFVLDAGRRFDADETSTA